MFSPVHYNHCSLLFLEDVVRILWADVYFLTWEDLHSGSDMKGSARPCSAKSHQSGKLASGTLQTTLSSSLSLLSILSLSTGMSLLHSFVLLLAQLWENVKDEIKAECVVLLRSFHASLRDEGVMVRSQPVRTKMMRSGLPGCSSVCLLCPLWT